MQEQKIPKTDEYAGGEIKELTETKVPLFLKATYLVLIIIGISWFYAYYDGIQGFLDRGYWHELAKAAKTTFSSW